MRPIRTLTEAELLKTSFHDCRVTALQWDRDAETFSLRMHYIVRWVEPADGEESYTYWVAPAVLTFEGVTSVLLDADWSSDRLVMHIDELEVVARRPCDNGTTLTEWEISFSAPDAYMKICGVGYRLDLLREAVHSRTMELPRDATQRQDMDTRDDER